MKLGNKIKYLRQQNKLSTRQLAEKLGVSQAHISKMENDENLPSLPLLEKLSKVLEVHITYFFEDIEKVERIEKVSEEGIDYIALDKKIKGDIDPEDIEKAIEFVKDLKNGKFDLDKLNKMNF